MPRHHLLPCLRGAGGPLPRCDDYLTRYGRGGRASTPLLTRLPRPAASLVLSFRPLLRLSVNCSLLDPASHSPPLDPASHSTASIPLLTRLPQPAASPILNFQRVPVLSLRGCARCLQVTLDLGCWPLCSTLQLVRAGATALQVCDRFEASLDSVCNSPPRSQTPARARPLLLLQTRSDCSSQG